MGAAYRFLGKPVIHIIYMSYHFRRFHRQLTLVAAQFDTVEKRFGGLCCEVSVCGLRLTAGNGGTDHVR